MKGAHSRTAHKAHCKKAMVVWGAVLCLLVVASLADHRHGRLRSAGTCNGGLARVAFFSHHTSRVASPDPLDDGTVNNVSFNVSVTFHSALSTGAGDLVTASLNVSYAYRHVWPQLQRVLLTPTGAATFVASLAFAAPQRPGAYALPFTVWVGDVPVLAFESHVEVTCSAAVVRWCDGERRWVESGPTPRCMRTYKPCGLETAVGRPQTDDCLKYDCIEETRSCAKVPQGGARCALCSPRPCTPTCAVGVVCGPFDGCGGDCGQCPSGTACNANGTACETNSCVPSCDGKVCGSDGCDGVCGPGCIAGNLTICLGGTQCVATLPGTCSAPYALFGNSMAPGAPGLNPLDTAGVQLFVLNNGSPTTTQPASAPITAATRDAHGLPADGVSVPPSGTRVRLFFDNRLYPDTVHPEQNGPGISDVVFQFRITAPVQAMEAYLLAQNGTVEYTDTFLALQRVGCTSASDVLTPVDVPFSDDATPPGALSSYVLMSALRPGDYVLVATTYAQSSAGPLWLEVVFTNSTARACVPICRGHYCGPNQCGGMCNVKECGDGTSCINGRCSVCPTVIPPNFQFQCTQPPTEAFPAPYTNSSYQRNCGFDADHCSLDTTTCGVCPAGQMCQLELGRCVTVAPCDA